MIEDICLNYIDKYGNNKKYIILDKFNKYNKNFIIYKEEKLDDIYASLYEIKDDKIKIIPIENDSDFDIVEEYLENM